MTDQTCASCQESLFIEVEPDSEVEDSKATAHVESVPDDVELSCGCHYHWYVAIDDFCSI
jgi:ferredoxin